jgi:transaldolase
MKFFVDAADPKEVRRWIDHGIAAGVTTNPLILRDLKLVRVEEILKEIVAAACDLPVSLQVGSTDPDAIASDAERYASYGPNVVVKVPVVGPCGTPTFASIRRLTASGIKVNATACMSAGQAIMAAMAGARYVSLLAGRIRDEGGDSSHQVSLVRGWLDSQSSGTELIVGSIRGPGCVYELLPARPHICTVAPAVLAKLADHSFARRTVAEFTAAADGLGKLNR